MDFSHEVRFSAGIGPAHFPAGGAAIDACAAAIFTFFYIPSLEEISPYYRRRLEHDAVIADDAVLRGLVRIGSVTTFGGV